MRQTIEELETEGSKVTLQLLRLNYWSSRELVASKPQMYSIDIQG